MRGEVTVLHCGPYSSTPVRREFPTSESCSHPSSNSSALGSPCPSTRQRDRLQHAIHVAAGTVIPEPATPDSGDPSATDRAHIPGIRRCCPPSTSTMTRWLATERIDDIGPIGSCLTIVAAQAGGRGRGTRASLRIGRITAQSAGGARFSADWHAHRGLRHQRFTRVFDALAAEGDKRRASP